MVISFQVVFNLTFVVIQSSDNQYSWKSVTVQPGNKSITRIFLTRSSMKQLLSMYLWLYSPLLELCRFICSFLIYTQSVGLLGRGISPSKGRYQHTGKHKNTMNTHRHPCLEWDSNPRFQCSNERRQFMS
jgi:hypothetical protein